MEVVETNTEGLLRDFKIVIAADDIQQRVDARLTEVGRDMRIPGFRPGKAPLNILKQRFGSAVMGEVLEAAVQDSSQEVLSDRGLRPAGQPKIEVVSFDEGKDLEYDLSVEILPEIDVVDLATIEVERVKVTPTDSEITDAIGRIAQQNRETKPIDTPRAAEKGDVVVIDFEGKIDNEPFDGGKGTGIRLELGSDQFIPGFEDQLVGVEPGKPVEVKVAFPDDYGVDDLAGKDAVFDCTIEEIHEAAEVTIDDAFAEGLGLENLGALKEAISEQLGQEYSRLTRERTKRDLLDKLSDTHDFEVPPRMADEEFDQIWQQIEQAKENDQLDEEDKGKSDDELREQYRDIALRRVRLGLLLSQIGEQNGLSVSQEEVNRAIMEQARELPGQEQQVVEFYRDNPQATASLQAPIFEDKVVDFIIEMANVLERELTPEELNAEAEAEANAAAEPEEKKPAKKKSTKKADKNEEDKDDA
ncbi:MAG: trigger factor [Alphaproteobacteria bacterium]|nr:trigger factor [Alphaproteobacteria bacterium]|tara:strand:+ start:1973 stop:3391 length:1419 start_codon:yes stop_codon:yes gene_type:complete